MQCKMDHIVLNMNDEKAMIEFYSETLALSMERLSQYRSGEVSFPSARLNPDTIIDLFPRRFWSKDESQGPGRTNLNHFCMTLAKEDWKELRGRLANTGVPIEEGPVPRWGAQGTGTSIYFRDPDGNVLEARYYEEEGEAHAESLRQAAPGQGDVECSSGDSETAR